MSYDPDAVLRAADENIAVVAVFGLIAAIATFTYLIECLRLARKHQAYPVALAAVGWFAIHDLIFVLNFDKWWNEYDHWWTKFWWFALCGTATMEIILTALVIRYGHRELMPQVSQRWFGAMIVAATAGIGAIWWFVKLNLTDDLYLISFPVTALWAIPFGTAMVMRRRSQRGQSPVLPLCAATIVVCFQGAFWPLDPMFRTWQFGLVSVTAVAWAAFEIWLMKQFPRFDPEVDSFEWPAEQALTTKQSAAQDPQAAGVPTR